jgi:hypothetical protein
MSPTSNTQNHSAFRVMLVGFLAAQLAGCVAEPQAEAQWAAVQLDSFVCLVEPVLERECSMPACHGSPARRMPVLAAGRMRIAGELLKAMAAQSPVEREDGMHPALTALEIEANFTAARAMIEPSNVATSPLLDRPLAVGAGGIFHFANAAGYQALLRWAQGAGVEACP